MATQNLLYHRVTSVISTAYLRRAILIVISITNRASGTGFPLKPFDE